MDNIALELVDEFLDEQNEGWSIKDDKDAEYALKKIAEEKAEAQRYINVCETMILDYKQKAQKTEEKLKFKLAYLEEQLKNYFATIKPKETKTQKTYKLPSGTLKLKIKAPEYIRDNEKLVKYLEDNDFEQYIKWTATPDWAGFKETISISEGKVIDEDGQEVEGITLQEREPEFIIEV